MTPDDKRKPGRPRSVDEPTPVSSWVQKQEYDRLCKLAEARRESLSAVVRQMITNGLKNA